MSLTMGALLCSTLQCVLAHTAPLLVSHDTAEKIATQIRNNECGKNPEAITSWNEGEAWASLGIGHFIWYPRNSPGRFQEQFPEFLAFVKKSSVAMPQWLEEAEGCPWHSRKDFLESFYDEKMIELRTFLLSTLPLQAQFIVSKLENALTKITATLSPNERKRIEANFYKVAEQPNGIYALADYLNFKGDGLSAQERYNGEGWGLLQVLQQIPEASPLPPVETFAAIAKTLLEQRVKNAPPERKEDRWLPGWCSRLHTYLSFTLAKGKE